MGDEEHFKILCKGSKSWDNWRRCQQNVLFEPDLSNADLSNRRLSMYDLSRVNFIGTNFSESNVRLTSFAGADCRRAVFSRAKLANSFFALSNVAQANFEGAEMPWVAIDHPWWSRFGYPFFDFAQADGIEDARINVADLDNYLSYVLYGLTHWEWLQWEYGEQVTNLVVKIKILQRLIHGCKPLAEDLAALKCTDDILVSCIRRHPEIIFEIKPRLFELLIGEILNAMGWRVCVTQETRDGGFDAFAETTEGHRILVECKRYASHRPVGLREVREVFGARELADLKNVSIMVVTSSRFSSDATVVAASRADVELIDLSAVMDWICLYDPSLTVGRVFTRRDPKHLSIRREMMVAALAGD